ncbi:hypothetical protein TSTA_080060 [Talaromyces stipitatus ATCC 10500]|uniref:Uncharacterized protein n=1 Tax=Talaromyces stipitatus (strain ATCC 10500 / CBS 375.48 / QM 6759 / NRRL 1006) TaxID=441959 RepID=B8LXR6_TALSN|nr:uncharacterized protein TSTA_080060 [Talaromyces stipitatus ATCC 10500]EED24651.1 hypothetical protein TSTA_080060 [Talaromyces stipitatus ATCC 10500]
MGKEDGGQPVACIHLNTAPKALVIQLINQGLDAALSLDELSSKQQDSQLSARIANPGKPLKRKEWTPEEDARLKQPREKDKLPWSQVKKHFPTRTAGAVQVRYYTAVKDSTSPSIEPVLQNRTKDTLDTASGVTSRSRPVRARRAVERYSPS